MQEDGTFDVLPKKEVAKLMHEMEKLQKNLGGIKEMTRIPDVMFIVDPRKEKIAIQEAYIHLVFLLLLSLIQTAIQKKLIMLSLVTMTLSAP